MADRPEGGRPSEYWQRAMGPHAGDGPAPAAAGAPVPGQGPDSAPVNAPVPPAAPVRTQRREGGDDDPPDLDLDVDALVDQHGADAGTPCDVVLLVPGWSDLDDWVGRKILYVPQRPRGTDPGARVYLCRERSLFYSYRIDGFLDLDESLPAGTTEGDEGWAIQVSDGRPIERPLDDIDDPSGVATRWVQGFRYLAPGAHVFVRSPRYRAEMPVKDEAVAPPPEPVAVPPEKKHKGFWARFRHDDDTK